MAHVANKHITSSLTCCHAMTHVEDFLQGNVELAEVVNCPPPRAFVCMFRVQSQILLISKQNSDTDMSVSDKIVRPQLYAGTHFGTPQLFGRQRCTWAECCRPKWIQYGGQPFMACGVALRSGRQTW